LPDFLVAKSGLISGWAQDSWNRQRRWATILKSCARKRLREEIRLTEEIKPPWKIKMTEVELFVLGLMTVWIPALIFLAIWLRKTPHDNDSC
jgi:hypothetical protein